VHVSRQRQFVWCGWETIRKMLLWEYLYNCAIFVTCYCYIHIKASCIILIIISLSLLSFLFQNQMVHILYGRLCAQKYTTDIWSLGYCLVGVIGQIHQTTLSLTLLKSLSQQSPINIKHLGQISVELSIYSSLAKSCSFHFVSFEISVINHNVVWYMGQRIISKRIWFLTKINDVMWRIDLHRQDYCFCCWVIEGEDREGLVLFS